MVAERRARTNLYAGPLTEISRREVAGIELRGGYVAERKHDGVWTAVHVDIGGSNEHRFESRTGLEFEGTDIDGVQGMSMGSIGKGSILVGELECSSEVATQNFKKLGYRRVFLFDVIQFRGQDLRDRPFRERSSLLRSTIKHAMPRSTQERFVCVEQAYEGFLKFYDRILAEGGEGMILKPLALSGKPSRSDGKTPDWIRVKPWRTVDYIVMAPARTEKGELSAKLGVWRNGKPRAVLQCSLPDLEEVDGKLVQEGKVVELIGREMFSSGALRHATFSRWRDDKRPEDCSGSWSLKGER